MPDCATLRVIVLDDDPRVGATLAAFLKPLKCSVDVRTDSTAFLGQLPGDAPDILITDLRMSGTDGIAVLRKMKECAPETEVIVVSGTSDKQDAIQALKLGAFDFFEKPVDREEMIQTIMRTVRYREVVVERDRYASQLSFLSRQEAARWGIDAFVGRTDQARQVVKDIRQLQATPRTSVLIMGESGTGKELIARAIHYGSARSGRPFVPVNCSAIPGELAESMLFGHAKGSFTGALTDRAGYFETAHEGTIFLDEIGDMPATLQVKLLRVLEDGQIVPVGRNTGRKVDVRVIAATNADLQTKISNGAFRADLFYRLAGFTFMVPPLRDRREDVPLLVEHFATLLSQEMGIAKPKIEADAIQALAAHDFPGNIRELRNIVERALIECGGNPIRRAHIHFLSIMPAAGRTQAGVAPPPPAPAAAPSAPPESLPANLRDAESFLIRRAMSNANGNVAEAARTLGISRPKLYRKLAGLGTDADTDPGE